MLPLIAGALTGLQGLATAKAGEAAIGAIGSRIGSGLLDKGVDKVMGVPTPSGPTSGGEQGQQYSNFMDSAFPGTTPWERLGANSPMGAVTSAETASKTARDLQRSQLATQERVADGNNRASIISSTAGLGPSASRSALSTYARSDSAPGYDTPVRQGRERTDAEVPGLRGRSAEYSSRGKYGDALARGEAYSQGRWPGTLMGILDKMPRPSLDGVSNRFHRSKSRDMSQDRIYASR